MRGPITDADAAGVFRELARQELISPTAEHLPLPSGNIDRRPELARRSWHTRAVDGRTIRFVIGAGLADAAERQRALSNACPGLGPEVIFYGTIANAEVLLEEFVVGETLESLVHRHRELAARVLGEVTHSLEATRQPSTETARLSEWESWTDEIERLAHWSDAERAELRTQVWPALYPLLASHSPVTRWTNGDLTASNVLRAADGNVRLIDCEFASRTHFFREDAARFYALSLSARAQPELFTSALERVGPPWHAYFLFRQLLLETRTNSETYLDRYRPQRLAALRRLLEVLLDRPLLAWRTPAAVPHCHREEFYWEQLTTMSVRISGWCFLPGTPLLRVVATQGEKILAESALAPRSDVQAHFGGDPLALNSAYGFSVPVQSRHEPIVISALANDGTWIALHSLLPDDAAGRGAWIKDYSPWSAKNDPDPPAPIESLSGPRFSILLPAFDSIPAQLRACVESIVGQHYSHWEVCAIDDGSSSTAPYEILSAYAATDSRIKVQRSQRNLGIAAATNAALASASGEFVVLVDHDDVLRPHALAEFARCLAERPATDVLYSDEDKISEFGAPVFPFFKPGFSPEFFLGVMYVGHALCVRTTVARSAGGFDPRFDGIQDYEFLLRVSELTRKITHIPRILYHWRQSARSSALHGDAKGDMDSKQKAAVENHLRRVGRSDRPSHHGSHRLTLTLSSSEPFNLIQGAADRDVLGSLRAAADSLPDGIVVFQFDEFSAASPDWAGHLAAMAARPDSGLVAPLILATEDRVHESGWTIGLHGSAPLMRGFGADVDGYNGALRCTREVALVSPLCFAVRANLLQRHFARTPELTWTSLAWDLRSEGRFHRVCADVKVKFAKPVPDLIASSATAPHADPFYNANFSGRGDYSLYPAEGDDRPHER